MQTEKYKNQNHGNNKKNCKMVYNIPILIKNPEKKTKNEKNSNKKIKKKTTKFLSNALTIAV